MQTFGLCARGFALYPKKAPVAIYHLSVKTISRSAGRSATAAAAYRAGVEITDERTGEVHDYRRKGGVEYAELVLPVGAPEWSADRAALWNAAEQAETRKNSTVAREFEIALPAELSARKRKQLALDFARELVDAHDCAADVAIHAPSRGGDSRNHHAHILLTTRRLTPKGFTEKTRELDSKATGPELVTQWRQRFAMLQNQRLHDAGLFVQVRSGSLEAQGIDREPTQHLGPAATGYERRTGQPSQNRQRHEREASERQANAQELEHQGAALDRAILNLSAGIEAAEQARQEAQAAAQARQKAQAAERERIERMSAAELRAEIDRVRPPPVRELVERDPAVIEAERQHRAAQEQGRQAQAREARAQREAADWREAHPVRAKMHDAGLVSAGFLVERDQEREQARADWLTAAPRIEDASQRARSARTEAEARATLETAPARAKADDLEKIAQQKERQEKAEREARYERDAVGRDFARMALKRELRAGGWSDTGSQWEAVPAPLRRVIEQYNAAPKDKRPAMLAQFVADPANVERTRSLLDQQKAQARGFNRGR